MLSQQNSHYCGVCIGTLSRFGDLGCCGTEGCPCEHCLSQSPLHPEVDHNTAERQACTGKTLIFPVLSIQCWLHWCIKVFSDQLCNVTASMTVVEKNTYIWTGGRSFSTELPVMVLLREY